jgi:N-acetylmuramoyl-L-alanine amidase
MMQTSVYVVLFLICSLFFRVAAVSGEGQANPLKPDTILNGTRYFSLNNLCQKSECTVRRDVEKRSFVCTSKNGTIRFFDYNRFIVRNDTSVTHLMDSPLLINGVWYLPEDAVALFPKLNTPVTPPVVANVPAVAKPVAVDTIKKNSAQSSNSEIEAQAAVPANKKGIRSVNCSVKQNGTLLTVQLSDSLPFDYMYYHPNLILNFFGGTVDTAKIKLQNKTGIVKSVSSVQFKESAQISIVLSTWIEEPVFDYVQDSKTVMVALRPAKKAPVQQPESVVKPAQKKGIIVVVDPGHGGKDPGAIGYNDLKEKDVVLSVSLKLRDMLKNLPAITTLLTRDKDVFIPLAERTEFANKQKADLFVSVHADAVPGDAKRKNSTRGYKIYFLSQAKNEEDKLVAMRENAVIQLEEKPQNYSNLQSVLIDMAGNEFLKESQDMCILLDLKFSSVLRKKIEKLHLGVGQANFWVLNGAYMPSVLIETGFLSNPEEAKLLADKEFQKTIAKGMYEAIANFTQQYGAGQ